MRGSRRSKRHAARHGRSAAVLRRKAHGESADGRRSSQRYRRGMARHDRPIAIPSAATVAAACVAQMRSASWRCACCGS
jgi:hypothetical protein